MIDTGISIFIINHQYKERVCQSINQLCMGPAAAKFLIFDLIVSDDRPSLEVSKTKISTLSDMPVKNADVYKLYYSRVLVQK